MRSEKVEEINGPEGEGGNRRPSADRFEQIESAAVAAPPVVVRHDPFMAQRDPRIPSDLGLTEKFQCWTGRYPAMTFIGLISTFSAAAGTATYIACEMANQGLSYWDKYPSGMLAFLSVVAAAGLATIIAAIGTEAGSAADSYNHKLTHRAAHYDRLANQAAEDGNERKENRYREKAQFERSVRGSGKSHHKSRHIIGADRMPLEPTY